ncbi:MULTISPECIES: ribonuclease J [unclassified Gemella]|uniref:ribonuclease J1 n=1 Tax=unclassified Gemella TaxID=2624949 RepID=UPI001073F55C|nr:MULTISPECIES: ribonuclease J [unclassified Gemella]MBF0710228.1 ribonuclease J [Gemella sp. GL1.1]MBF0746528.1 ribonuclease J [Gemella sp. 19428wG2_WT2a]NYS27572.1 ribonuclease J [Gemella sp. GL1]TFU60306.1 ribonuclease J [Gemella sp. WT2a]
MDRFIERHEVGVAAIGGMGEIGKNTYAIQYQDEIIIIDAGVKFPGDNILGIDYIIPDYTYIVNNIDKVKALIITHGHEDHIGGIPFLLKQVSLPIYAGPLAIGLIQSKLEEHNLLAKAEFHEINEDTVLQFKNLSVEFHNTTHSIPDAFGVIINSPQGKIVHTGDFKFDFTPVGEPANLYKMAKVGEEGVLCLLSDSTNSERSEFTMSEKEVGHTISDILRTVKHRIIFATFASNVFRVKQVVEACIEHDRKIVVFGRSMEKAIKIGTDLGYIKAPKDTFVDPKRLKQIDPNKLLILCTGTQGEELAALTRIAHGTHKKITIMPTDTVVFASSAIPGNAVSINKNIDLLSKLGANVITSSINNVHTSGHAAKEEQKLMFRLIKPKYFMPIHGEYRMQVLHAKTAVECDVKEENTFILANGDILALTQDSARVTGKIEANDVYVDGLGIGDIGNVVIKDRKDLSENGVAVVSLVVNFKKKILLAQPDIIVRGFGQDDNSKELIKESKTILQEAIANNLLQDSASVFTIRQIIIETLVNHLEKQVGRRPVVVPAIIEI